MAATYYSFWCFIIFLVTLTALGHIPLTNLDIAGDLILMMRSSVLMLITVGVCDSENNVNTDVDHIPLGLKPMPYTSAALAERYLGVHQRKL